MSAFNTLMKEDIIVKRPTAGEGYIDSEGNWVTSVTITDVPMKGNIQPYTSTDISDGKDTIPFRDGFDSSAARNIFTDQLVYGVSRQDQREPDEIEFEGYTWLCWRVYSNLNNPLVRLRHCESVWVRRDALST